MKHIDVTPDGWLYLAERAGWGPQKTAIVGWLSRTFRTFVRIRDQMARVSNGH